MEIIFGYQYRLTRASGMGQAAALEFGMEGERVLAAYNNREDARAAVVVVKAAYTIHRTVVK